jgi:hypothetical protein
VYCYVSFNPFLWPLGVVRNYLNCGSLGLHMHDRVISGSALSDDPQISVSPHKRWQSRGGCCSYHPSHHGPRMTGLLLCLSALMMDFSCRRSLLFDLGQVAWIPRIYVSFWPRRKEDAAIKGLHDFVEIYIKKFRAWEFQSCLLWNLWIKKSVQTLLH